MWGVNLSAAVLTGLHTEVLLSVLELHQASISCGMYLKLKTLEVEKICLSLMLPHCNIAHETSFSEDIL